MRKITAIAGLFVALTLTGVAAILFFLGQRPAYAWRPSASAPSFVTELPRVLIDEAHHNASTAGVLGRYMPFARLLRADGFRVVRNPDRITPIVLSGADVLVVANASGASRLQFWGFNLPIGEQGDRAAPAFSAAEIETIRTWVQHGGSLLLIADHEPFGAASAQLAAAFGVTMHAGSVEVPGAASDPLVFDRASSGLGEHPVLEGVDRVLTFSGQSLSGPQTATILLRLPENAIEYVAVSHNDAAGTTTFESRPAGPAQAIALEYGAGRVAILGEAAMLTAQVAAGRPFGFNTPGNDNEAFALNLMRWLARAG